MKQKIINYTIGTMAVVILLVAVFVLIDKKDSENVVYIGSSYAVSENLRQNNVLGETTAKTNITANIIEKNQMSDGRTEIAVSVELINTSSEIVQFSPPIDISLMDSVSNRNYRIEAHPLTTLLGGPLSPNEKSSGNIYIILESPLNQTNLELLYQPNYSTSTQSIELL